MTKLENQKVLLTMVSLSLGLLYSTHPGAARGSHSASRQHRPTSIAMKPAPTSLRAAVPKSSATKFSANTSATKSSANTSATKASATTSATKSSASTSATKSSAKSSASTSATKASAVSVTTRSSASPGTAGFQPATTKHARWNPATSSSSCSFALQSSSTHSPGPSTMPRQRQFIASAGLANGSESIEVDSALLSVLRDISKSLRSSDDAVKIENLTDKAALNAALAALDQAIGVGSAQANRIVSQESKERLEGKIAPESWESGALTLPDSGHASLNVLWAKRVNGNVTISIAGDCKATAEDGSSKPIAFVVVINGKSTLDSGFDIQSQSNVHFWLGKLNGFSIDAGLPDLQANTLESHPLHALPTARKQVLVQSPNSVIESKSAAAVEPPKSTFVPESPKSTFVPESPKSTFVPESPKSAFVPESPKSTFVPESPKRTFVPESPREQFHSPEFRHSASENPESSVEIMPARLQPSGVNGRLEFPPSSSAPVEMHSAINAETQLAPESNNTSSVQIIGESASPPAVSNRTPVETISISSSTNVPEATISVTPIAGDEVSSSSNGNLLHKAESVGDSPTLRDAWSAGGSSALHEAGNTGGSPTLHEANSISSTSASSDTTSADAAAIKPATLNTDSLGNVASTTGGSLVSAIPSLQPSAARSTRTTSTATNSQSARVPSATAHIVTPDRAVAGEYMTVAVVSKDQKPEPNVSVSFNGNVVTTSTEGRATFQVPEEAQPGPSLQIGLDAKPEYKASAVHVLQPLVKPAAPLTPQIDHVSEVATAGGTVIIDGHNFHGLAEQNRVIFDARHEAKILVASPVQLKVLLPATLPPGQHAVTVATNGLSSNAGQCQMVAVQVQPMGKADKTDKWMVKIVGTQNKVRVRLSNDSPDVIKLLKGNQQTVITPGGSNNLVTLNGQRINRGLPHLITSVEPLQ